MDNLSFSIVALDKQASETFIRLATHVERLSDKLDALGRKDVTANVNVKTDESRRALDSFSTRFKLMVSGIVAASPLAGAAIIGGIGAGFTGIAVLAQKSNKDVQTTYTQLWRNVVASTKNATDQVVPQIVGAGRSIDSQLQRLGPDFERAFSFAGPNIVALSRGVGEFAHNAMPGLTSAMQNSLPVTEGVAAGLGQLGTAFADTATSMSQHATEYGIVVQSVTGIASTALSAGTDVVNTLGVAWAHNAAGINASVAGVGGSISGLAQGALPVLDAGLGATADLLNGVVSVLQPVSPILGVVGTAALATWGAFKLAALAELGVKKLAMGVVSLGANMEAGAAKSAVYIAGLRGVDVAASTTARTVTAAGTASATAAVRFGAAASALAGPLGIALIAGTALLGIFTSGNQAAAAAQQELSAATDSLTSAFETSHGALDKQVRSAIEALPAFKRLTDVTQEGALSQGELIKAVTAGGPALDQLKKGLSDALANAGIDDKAKIAGKLAALFELELAYKNGKKAAEDNAAAQQVTTRILLGTSQFQGAAASSARTLGISLGDVSEGFQVVVATGAAASDSVQDVARAYYSSALSVAAATQQVTDHFAAADKAVTQAQRSVADAGHSYEQSVRAIADAERSAEQAHRAVADAQHSAAASARSVQDAYANVTSAERTYATAQQRSRETTLALNAAREQAVDDLKALHLQLEDQVASEENARVRLFEALQSAGSQGVTADNARALAAQQVTAGNLEQVKAALAVVDAQNAVNDSTHAGANLRDDVAAADRAGVEGSEAVVAAQQAVQSADEQVRSAKEGLVKAHQQVTDAEYSLVRAQEAVADASYAERRAHQQVTDAQYQSRRAADQLALANQALADAQAADRRGFDLSTKAGQDNMRMLLGLWDVISKTGMPQASQYRAMIEQTASAFGMSRQAAYDYLQQLGLIPRDFRYSVTAVAGVDFAPIMNVLSSGDIQSRGGRYFVGLAGGGPVGGTGGPRDDSNLIWASRGEYMQPADAVDHYGLGFMEAVRSKKLRVMGRDGAQGYASGGLVAAARAGTAYQSSVTALTVMGLPHPSSLPRFKDGGWMVPGGRRTVEPVAVQTQMSTTTTAQPREVRVSFKRGGTALERALLEFLRTRIQVDYGGDVQKALGT